MISPRHVVSCVIVGALLVAGLIAVIAGSPYTIRVLSVAGCFAIMAIGYQIIFGHAGALSLSQGTFFGVGAYASAILSTRYGFDFEAALLLGIAAPLGLAAIVALPVLRLQTHYFALATLVISQFVFSVVTQWESVTGGANGIAGVPGVVLVGRPIASGLPLLVAIWVCVGLVAVGTWFYVRGRRGAQYALMRHNQPAAGSVGLDTGRMRLIAFLISAALAGLAGSLYVRVESLVSPDLLEFPVMVTCLTIAVVGSRLRIAGAIVGAILIVGLPEWTRTLHETYLLGYGVVLLLVVIVVPDGLVVAAERLLARQLPKRKFSPAPRDACEIVIADRLQNDHVLLEVHDLSRSFGGIAALDGVTFTLNAREIVGLIGPNGSGKTTLINAICGVFPPSGGRIVLAGRNITHLRPHVIARLGLGRTFQSATLIEDLTAVENVAVCCKERDAVVYLREAGFDGDIGVECSTLSTTARTRVEIARALAHQPKLLVLDEPAAGANDVERADIAARLRAIAATGVGILIVEHDLAFLSSFVDRLICLDSGRILATGTPAEVMANPEVLDSYVGPSK
jgi:branched-chain amino acid transport system permease protein